MARSPRKALGKKTPKEKIKPKVQTSITGRRIEVRMGMTVNLGDYQSQRIDLGFAGDIKDDEILEEKYDQILTWVEDKLSAEVDLIKRATPVLNKMKNGREEL